MKTAVLVLNFGEPEEPTLEQVVPFLERIFMQNSTLESHRTPEQVRERSRQLAEERAPGLVEEYEEIGGSPLNPQARRQAAMLRDELRSRGHEVETFPVFQFTEPFVADGVRAARDRDADLVVCLPVYPLCGRSTTIAALEMVREALEEEEWDVPLREVTGWHRHPDYVPLHADNIREFVNDRDVDLYDPGTMLLFSVHGTPLKYVDEGPRYVKYAQELSARIARELGKSPYEIGYQNHRNRPIEWTEPDVDRVVAGADADRVVVMAASFMHEQSETLAELDDELREVAEEHGIEFHRVPIPHESSRFIDVLADLTEPLLDEVPAFNELQLKRCLCRKTPYTFCLNAGS